MDDRRPATAVANPPWTLADAADLYGVETWGKGYFGINSKGHLTVRPMQKETGEIDVLEVVEGLSARGLTTPLLLRFSDVLAHRLRQISDAFAEAIADNEYRGHHLAVYPIKVNQQRHVVAEIHRFGQRFGFGLEVGSKPELLAALGLTRSTPACPIICNGFKDDEYIESVVLAKKLGRNIIPVVEKFSELHLIVKHARRYKVRPRFGIRVKLASQGVGRWSQSAGYKSKFGLSISEVLDAFHVLRESGMEDCLELVHCHMGSQIHDIKHIKDGVYELARVYVELKRLGAGLGYLDIGGGLGIDYDGSQSNSESSVNYTLAEYATDVVYRVKSVCDAAGVPHPTIVTECGRAIVAYHAALVFNVLGGSSFDGELPVDLVTQVEDPTAPQPIRDLWDAYNSLNADSLLATYHDAAHARDEAVHLFTLGYMSLPMRALAERLFWATSVRIRDLARGLEDVPEELAAIEDDLRDTYFCNFSVFQSMPDSWALEQVFPVMPIHRLAEQPSRRTVLADVTCDSDGKVDVFQEQEGERETIALHPLEEASEYYLGAFLVGAYQETLGDLHNLFGDTHAVHIRGDGHGGWMIDHVIEGDTVREVLGYVQYDPDRLLDEMRQDCERAVREGSMTVDESRSLLAFYRSGLDGYTYLEGEEG